jgi:beta-galactosidase
MHSTRSTSRRIHLVDGRFMLDGAVHVFRAGELHYSRIPPDYWRHRMMQLRSAGLNTVCTYVFWNFHEIEPGHYDFTGEKDVAGFCRLAGELGLHVVIRPGPYACSEWDLGGIPSRLLSHHDIALRSSDPRFLEPARDWLRAVSATLTPLQCDHGGPIVMVQVENEYGAYASDRRYLDSLKRTLTESGWVVPMVRCDWTYTPMMRAGHTDGVHALANFGKDAAENIGRLGAFSPAGPRMSAEFWTGWFDWFGGPRNSGDIDAIERQFVDLEWMLANDVSFSLYMFHGGTNFGMSAGANNQGGRFRPYQTSYDFGAPVGEGGQTGQRFERLRALIARHTNEPLPPPPEPIQAVAIPPIAMEASAPMFGTQTRSLSTVMPQCFESMGQSLGCALYRVDLGGRTACRELLRVRDLHDYAVVFLNGQRVGTLDRSQGRQDLMLDIPEAGPAVVEILVEAMGHVNFGADINDDRKGITRRVEHGWHILHHWTTDLHPLDATQLAQVRFNHQAATPGAPTFFRGRFDVETPADTHLDLSGWGKGYVWINGRCLGRFWSVGPQQTLYLPAPWLRAGGNEVIVLDLLNDHIHPPTVCGRIEPILADLKLPAGDHVVPPG